MGLKSQRCLQLLVRLQTSHLISPRLKFLHLKDKDQITHFLALVRICRCENVWHVARRRQGKFQVNTHRVDLKIGPTGLTLSQERLPNGKDKGKLNSKKRQDTRDPLPKHGTGSWAVGQPEARDPGVHLLEDLGGGCSCSLNQSDLWF